MICKCAEADALRSSFPTMVGGLYLREEMDFIPDVGNVKRPIFEAPTIKATAPVAEPQAEAASEAQQPDAPPADDDSNPELMPEPEKPVTKATPNYLKGVRGLCAAAKVKEGELLEFTAQIGMSDGSAASLEDLALTNSNALKLIYDNWSGDKGISTQIIAARKAGGK